MMVSGAFSLSKADLKVIILGVLLMTLLSSNAILRIEAEGVISVARVLVCILTFSYFFRLRKNKKLLYIFFLLFFVFYSFVAAYLSPYGVNSFASQFTVHYILLFSAIFIGWEYSKNKDVLVLSRIMKLSLVVFLSIASLVFISGWDLPFVESGGGVIRGWYTSENDFSLVLATLMWGWLSIRSRKNTFGLLDFSIISVVFFVIILNDARVLLLGLVLFFFVSFYARVAKLLSISSKICVLFFVFFVVFVSFLIISPVFFLAAMEPLARIFTLDQYNIKYGSIFNRVDASIYGIKAFMDSYFLGVGAGNSLSIIQGNYYGVLGSAKSFHNIFVQFLAELGLLSVFLFWFFIKNYRLDFLILNLFPIFLCMLAQSSGIFSNYLVFFVFGIVCYKNIKVIKRHKKGLRNDV
jgi:hypothetical protein